MCEQCNFTDFLKTSDRSNMAKASTWLKNYPTLLLSDRIEITNWFKEISATESSLEIFNNLLSDNDLKKKLVLNSKLSFYGLKEAKKMLRESLWHKEQTLCPPITAFIKELIDIHVLKHHYLLQKTFTPRGVHMYNSWSTLNTKRGDHSCVYSYKLHDFVLTVKE